MDLSREQQGEASFLTQFDGIGLEGVEPECPFCGELLERGQCTCKEFKTAYAKLLKSYPEQDLILEVNNNVRTIITFPLKKEKLIVTPVSLTDGLILLLNKGTIARGSRGTYFVSEGSIEGKDLKFYIRQKRKKEAYKCLMKNIADTPQEAKIILYKYITKRVPEIIVINNEQTNKRKSFVAYYLKNQQETIAEFGYGAFLARLQELMKDK